MNKRLAFDAQILLPNLTNNIDLENNPMNKDFNYKVAYNLKIENEKAEKKRVISKIFKLDEKNQYGNGMTKPLPTGCRKDDLDISWEIYIFLLEKVDFDLVDIAFDINNATKRELAYNETYPPIIEKQKIIDPCERSVFQLLEQFIAGENGPRSYRSTAKAHAALFKKKIYQCI